MKNNKIKFTLLAFVLPILVLFIISIISNHVPFGKYLFNCYDSYNMYPALLLQFIRGVKSGNSFFTMFGGFGVDFFNIKTLYMNSPLNYLALFFKENQIFSFFTFIIFLRTGLASLTMYIYLNSISKDKYTWKQIVFAMLYALSSYGLANAVHIMWMDSFILLPLIILGLDELILKNKSFKYILFLSLAIIINFYFGYMLCIFSLLYFCYKSYIEKKFNFKIIKRFVISSLLCGLLSSVVLIPEIISLMGGRGSEFDIDPLLQISFYTMFTESYQYFVGSYISFDNFIEGSVILTSSIVVLLLNIGFYFNNKFSKREKIATLVLSIFFVVGFFVNFIDYAWNMFQAPVWWSHRYSFVFVFFMVLIAYKCYLNIDDLKLTRKNKIIIFSIVSLLGLSGFIYKTIGMNLSDRYVVSFLLSLIFIIIYMNYYSNKNIRKYLVVLIMIEIIFSGYNIYEVNSITTTKEKNEYISEGEFVNIIDKDHRVIKVGEHENTSLFFGYLSDSVFSSSYDKKIYDFYKLKIGVYSGGVNHYKSEVINPAVISLMGIKYIIGNSNYFTQADDNIFINNDALDLGIVLPKYNEVSFVDGDYLNNINKLYSSILDENVDLFVPLSKENVETNISFRDDETMIYDRSNVVSMSDKTVMVDYTNAYSYTYSFVAPCDGVVVPFSSFLHSFMFLTINGEEVQDRYDENFDCVYYLNKGDKVDVKFLFSSVGINYSYNITLKDFDLYILEDQVYSDAIGKIKEYNSLDNIDVSDVIKGSFVSEDDSTLFLTIPYNKGFTVFVDGKKTSYRLLFDTFLGVDVSKGEHEIEIKYKPSGYDMGILFSSLGLIFTVIYLRKKND